MLGAIKQMGTDYYDALPDRILPTLMQSAVFSFAACAILPKPGEMILNRPLQAAAIATMVSLIHALITPLFKYCFESNENMWYAELTKAAVVVALKEGLMQARGSTTNHYWPIAMNVTAMAWNGMSRRTHHDNSAYIYCPGPSTW